MSKKIVFLIAALALLGLTFTAQAGEFPDKAIKLVVPYAPGGGSDVSARVVAKHLNKYLPVEVVVTNMTGGSGKVAEAEMMKTKPDGYTLMWQHQILDIAYVTGRSDYTWEVYQPVCLPAQSYMAVVVPKNSPYKTIQDVIAAAKADPGKILWGMAPLGFSHFAFLAIADAADLDLNMFKLLPMSGDKNRIVAMLQGNMAITSVTASSARPYIESGDLINLGIMADTKLPGEGVFTLKEKGIDAVTSMDYAVYAPKGTPADRVKILADAFTKCVQDPETVKEMEAQWLYPADYVGEALMKKLHADLDAYKAMAEKYGLKK